MAISAYKREEKAWVRKYDLETGLDEISVFLLMRRNCMCSERPASCDTRMLDTRMRVATSLVGVLAFSSSFSSSECGGTCIQPHGSGRAELPHENQDSACVLSDCGFYCCSYPGDSALAENHCVHLKERLLDNNSFDGDNTGRVAMLKCIDRDEPQPSCCEIFHLSSNKLDLDAEVVVMGSGDNDDRATNETIGLFSAVEPCVAFNMLSVTGFGADSTLNEWQTNNLLLIRQPRCGNEQFACDATLSILRLASDRIERLPVQVGRRSLPQSAPRHDAQQIPLPPLSPSAPTPRGFAGACLACPIPAYLGRDGRFGGSAHAR